MSNLFRNGNWSFGRRTSDENRFSLTTMDESIDVGSNLPVYLSRKEATEWHVPVNTESATKIRIIDDDEQSNRNSDAAFSVTSGSAREFWLNCLKENGVDMNAGSIVQQASPRKSDSYDRVSPRIPLSVQLNGVSPSQSNEGLTPRESLGSQSAREERFRPEQATSRSMGRPSQGSYTSFHDNYKYGNNLVNTALATDKGLSNPGRFSESTMSSDRVTAERGRKSQEWNDNVMRERRASYYSEKSVNRQIPHEVSYQGQAKAEPQPTNTNNKPLYNEQKLSLTDDHPSEIIIKASVDSTESAMGKDLIATLTRSEDDQDYLPQIQAALTSGTFDTEFTDDHNYFKCPDAAPTVKVTTVNSDDDDDDVSSVGMSHTIEEKPQIHLDTSEKLVEGRKSFDMSKGTSPLVSKVQCQSTPKILKSASWKETFKAAKKSSHVPSKTSNVETKNPNKGSYQTVTNSTWMLNDEYGWMYEVWERKGLMRKKGALVLREKNRVKPILSKTQKDPLQSSKITVGTGEMLRVKPLPPKPEKEPIPTPKEALVSVDYNALQADQVGDKIPNPKQRQSLPADLRQPTQNNAGRKSFDNIKKMWQHKTEDQPNSFFSPERYMKERRQSHDPERARPTQHSQLLSIAERTAADEGRAGISNPRPVQSGSRVTPRSKSVGSAQRLAGSAGSRGRSVEPSDSGSRRRMPGLTYSPPRKPTLDEKLQRPNSKVAPSNRRKSSPLPQRRETFIAAKDHIRRPNIGRSSSNYKSDYKTIVKNFLASVAENKELVDASPSYKKDAENNTPKSTIAGTTTFPKEINTAENGVSAGVDIITPRNEFGSSATQDSASKISPWTQQVVSKLEKVPFGSDGKTESWRRQERPWREDLVKQRVSDFSDAVSVLSATEEGACKCSASVFSSNDELVEFFLPLMGMACTCGRRPMGLINPEEPTSLENILRPWQVKFLAAFGIHRGDQLVKAHHRSAKALANALRQYRRKHEMTPFRTKSCGMALQIWSKTSKSYVRSIRKQLLDGTSELKVPNTLYIISSFLEKMHEMHSPMPRKPNQVYEDEASV